MNMNVDNKINIEDIKEDLKDFVKCSKFPYSDEKEPKYMKILIISCMVEMIIFQIFAKPFLGNQFFLTLYVNFAIGIFIYFIADVTIIHSIISKYNKKYLLERINQITTYKDISEIIYLIQCKFEMIRITKNPTHDLFDITRLKANIDAYHYLTNRNTLSIDITSDIKNETGEISIKLKDKNGYVDEKQINVQVRENVKLDKLEITIYPYEMIKLCVPYSK